MLRLMLSGVGEFTTPPCRSRCIEDDDAAVIANASVAGRFRSARRGFESSHATPPLSRLWAGI